MDGAEGETGFGRLSEGDQHSHRHGHQHDAQRPVGPQGGARRIEVITGPDRRRRWTDAEKARITAESFAPGATVSGVARRHSMSLGLLYQWRRYARADVAAEVSFVPVLPADGSDRRAVDAPGGESFIEIEVGDVRIRLGGPVDGAALRTVIAAARASS